jgi:hypothetical protein
VALSSVSNALAPQVLLHGCHITSHPLLQQAQPQAQLLSPGRQAAAAAAAAGCSLQTHTC